MVHCATILGLDHWVLSVFVGNSKHEIVEQAVDAMFAAELIEQVALHFAGRQQAVEDRLDLLLAQRREEEPPPKILFLRCVQA